MTLDVIEIAHGMDARDDELIESTGVDEWTIDERIKLFLIEIDLAELFRQVDNISL